MMWVYHRIRFGFRLCLFLGAVLTSFPLSAEYIPSGMLEIHYINVGQGGSTLIIGPNGTRILYDYGQYGGNRDIIPYLRDTVKLDPTDGLHYAIVSHRDRDHYMGYRDLIEAGYDIKVANYGSGSPKIGKTVTQQWLDPARTTTAGEVRPIPVGLAISLGNGAEAVVMAANGKVYGHPKHVNISNENDRSVVLFIHYGNFQYILDGDLGAAPETCTKHQTSQKDVQTVVAQALLNLGYVTADNGVDVMHIAHHGSESSTSAVYYDMLKPEVGLISVGLKNKSYMHPRKDVVEGVLLAGNARSECATAPALHYLFQTEDGETGCLATGCTSNKGLSIGDIKLVTDGKSTYTITGNNRVHEESEREAPTQPVIVTVDEINN